MRPGVPAHVTATAVVSAVPARLLAVVIGTPATGQTAKVHDCAATGDAAAGNLKATFALEAGNTPGLFGPDGAMFTTGIVVVISGGTPDLTVIHG